MELFETIVVVLLAWFFLSFISGFISNYKELSDEYEEDREVREFSIRIDVEQINNLWYGWTTDDDKQAHFVGQGITYQDAIEKCTERVTKANPNSKILFKFMVKKHEPDAVQN